MAVDERFIREYVGKKFNRTRQGSKHHLLMLFETELTLGLSPHPNRWACTNVIYFDNGTNALEAYSNIPNPASQLVSARSEEELVSEAVEMLHSMRDEEWLDENLYPYL